MSLSLLRDAADRPEASYWPKVADAVDSDFDRACEWLAALSLKLPAGVQSAWFFAEVGKLLVAWTAAADEGGGDGRTCSTELVARLLAELIDADNPRLHAKCLAFSFGLPLLQGKSETEIAEEEGVRKATVSKRCIGIKERFGIPPSRGMKSEEAVEKYRRRQRGRRAKPLPAPWPFRGLLTNAYAAAA